MWKDCCASFLFSQNVGNMSGSLSGRPQASTPNRLTLWPKPGVIKCFKFLLGLFFKALEELHHAATSVCPVHSAEALQKYCWGHKATSGNSNNFLESLSNPFAHDDAFRVVEGRRSWRTMTQRVIKVKKIDLKLSFQ